MLSLPATPLCVLAVGAGLCLSRVNTEYHGPLKAGSTDGSGV